MSTVIPGVHYSVRMYEWVDSVRTPSVSYTNSWAILGSDVKSKTIGVNSAIMFVVTVASDVSHRKINQGDGLHVQSTIGDVHATNTDFMELLFQDGSKFYWCVIKPAGKAGTSSKITASNFTVAFDNNSTVAVGLNSGAYTGLGIVDPKAGTFPAGGITITTTAAISKTLPDAIVEFLGGKGNVKHSAFNPITNTWIVVANISGVYFEYSFPYPWSKPYTSPASTSVGKYTAVKYKSFDAALTAANNAAASGKTTAKKPTPKPKPDSNGGGTGVDGDQSMKTSQWNPPPHFATRTSPFMDALDLVNSSGNIGDLGDRYASSQLGRMYQDDYALNKKNPNSSKLWGFRFMYNPTSISYSTNTDTAIDWTLGKADPSKALGGNTTVNIELYLNRIFDLKYLNSGGGSAGYPTKLGDQAIKGLTTRGTEYDLEYLYRVVNGDPQANQALIQDGKTSDLGYITGMPFWLHINDNMRFFGSLGGLSVNHVIFTQDMIPVFSTVTLSFVRYPATTTTSLTKRAKQFQKFQAGGDSTPSDNKTKKKK